MKMHLFTALTLFSMTSLSNANLLGVPRVPSRCMDEIRAPHLETFAIERAIGHVYSPKGFDTNDIAEVIVSGWLASPCDGEPLAEAFRQGENIYVSVKSTPNGPPGRICLAMAVPFLIPVKLGSLPEGAYFVHYNSQLSQPKTTTLSIDPAITSQMDSHLYAHVESAHVESGKLHVKGSNPSDCIAFDRFEIISNLKDTYSILPIMKQIKRDCPRQLVDFDYTVYLPTTLNEQDVLLHVRSLDGKSVNTLLRR